MSSNEQKNGASTSHITRDFLETVLERKIDDYKVFAGANPGDNFNSALYALQVKPQGQEEPLHLVLKCFPDMPVRQQFLSEANIFSKEVKVYKELIPILVKFQEDNGAQDADIIRPPMPPLVSGAARDYSIEDSINKEAETLTKIDIKETYLLMVDVRKCGGYQMVDKNAGLDLDHTTMAIKEIAKFHGLSWVYRSKKGLENLRCEFPYLVETVLTSDSAAKLLDDNFKVVEEIAKNNYDPDSRPIRGLQQLKEIGPMRVFSAFLRNEFSDPAIKEYLNGISKEDEDSEKWEIACHGDFWMNNMMFKYDNDDPTGKPRSLILVDLQFCREGCPMTELAYMFYTSTTYELRKNHMAQLIQLYHDGFIGVCEQFGVVPPKGFTLPTLMEKMRRAKIQGLLSASFILPIILSESLKMDDLKVEKEEGSGSNETEDVSDIFKLLTATAKSNVVMNKRFTDMLKELVEDGVF